MANDPSLRFATNVFDTDGTDKVYDLTFALNYIDKNYVFAMSGVESETTGLITDVEYHVVNFIDANDGNRVQVAPVPAAGRKLVLYRQTDIEQLLVQWSDGKLVNGRNLDLSAKQLLMAIQEIMDGLRQNNVIVEQQIGAVVNLDLIIRQLYDEVIRLLTAAGIISAAPRTWGWVTEEDTLDYPMVGADVDGPGMYDTYYNGRGLRPDRDYTVDLVDNDPTQTMLTLLFNPEDGADLFTVLRGYAMPYQGAPPATTADLRTPVIDVLGEVYFPTLSADRALLKCWNDAGCAVNVNLTPSTGSPATRLDTGSYYTIRQKGVGQVNITADPGVTIDYPLDCLPSTRMVNSAITLTCEDGENNLWLLTGDMARV